jgi:flavorubredoxin
MAFSGVCVQEPATVYSLYSLDKWSKKKKTKEKLKLSIYSKRQHGPILRNEKTSFLNSYRVWKTHSRGFSIQFFIIL